MDDNLMKIKELRLKQNLTQSDVAKSMGITREAYALVEMGKTKLKPSKLLEISNALGVDPSYFGVKEFNNILTNNLQDSSIIRQMYDKAIDDIEWYKKEIVRLTEQNSLLLSKSLASIEAAFFPKIKVGNMRY